MTPPNGLICFDLWDTLIRQAHFGALLDARIPALRRALAARGYEFGEDQLRAAHALAQAQFEDAWAKNTQFRTDQAAVTMTTALGVTPSATDDIESAIVEGGRRCEIEVVDGARSTVIDARSFGLPVVLICDVGLTPSSVLREWLNERGFAGLFDWLSFSDETGFYKPHRSAFDLARQALALPHDGPGVHVGDRRRTDVAGALAAGLIPIRFTGVTDDRTDGPEAPYVAASMSEVASTVRAIID